LGVRVAAVGWSLLMVVEVDWGFQRGDATGPWWLPGGGWTVAGGRIGRPDLTFLAVLVTPTAPERALTCPIPLPMFRLARPVRRGGSGLVSFLLRVSRGRLDSSPHPVLDALVSRCRGWACCGLFATTAARSPRPGLSWGLLRWGRRCSALR